MIDAINSNFPESDNMNYLSIFTEFLKLKMNTRKTREKIKSIQEKKFRKLIKFAFDNSQYYNKLYTQAGITRESLDDIDITNLPTVNKSDVLNNFDRLITRKDITQKELADFDNDKSLDDKLCKEKYHIVHSSGSTGNPAYFLYDKKAWDKMLSGMLRGALWDMSLFQIFKFVVSRPKIMYVAATDGRYGGAMAVGDGIEGIGASQLFIDINTPLNQWVSKINDFKPNVIIGYPSAVKILGELIESGKISISALRVVSCGEPLRVGLREYFEKVFNTTVANYYGASEALILGAETDGEDGMYLFDDMNYFEIINDKMYVTCLYNFAQPLIRYEISDRLNIKDDNFSKYPFTRVETILGRDEDILWFENKNKDKEFLHPLSVEGFSLNGMRDYQFVQKNNKGFELIIEADDGKEEIIKEKMTENINKVLCEKNLDNVEFYIKFIDRIIPDKISGKKRLTIKVTDE